MKYLCLGYRDEKAWESMSQDRRKALMEERLAYQEIIRKAGHLVDGRSLQPIRSAIALRFENGKVSIIPGSIAENDAQLRSFMLLEAHDLNHAIQLMSHLPCMSLGEILEIRPIDGEESSQPREVS